MADEFTVGVTALYNNTELKSGTDETATALEQMGEAADTAANEINTAFDSAETAVESLESQVEASADAMDSALDTVGDGADRMTTDVESSGGKMADVGSEIGAEFSENVSEAFQSGDFVGATLETFASLTPAIGALGIGFGAAALVANQFIQGTQQKEAEIVSQISSTMGKVETEVSDTANKIEKALFEAFTVEDAVTKFGGTEEVADGWAKINELTILTGRSVNEIVNVIRGDQSKATREVVEILEEQAALYDEQMGLNSELTLEQQVQGGLAKDLLDTYRTQTGIQETQLKYETQQRDWERDRVGYAETYNDAQARIAENLGRGKADLERISELQRNLSSNGGRVASDAERYAAAMERANDAILQIAGRRLPTGTELAGG